MGGSWAAEEWGATLVAVARQYGVGSGFRDALQTGTTMHLREWLGSLGKTTPTRPFSRKRARGIVNGFLERNSSAAPAAYPHVHYLTAPMRTAARAAGEPDLINLWAGQAYELIEHGVSAEHVIERMAAELEDARDAMARSAYLGRRPQ